MKNIKIAFFDIDGTLIDMDTKIITQNTLNTLKTLQKKGIKVCVATGRPPKSIPSFDDFIFDAYLTFNASYCYSEKDVIRSTPIPKEDVQKIIENTTKINRPVLLSSKDRNGANGCDQRLKEYMAISKQDVEVISDFETFSKEEIYQIMLGFSKDELSFIMQDVHNAQMTAWWPYAGDIIFKNGGKGKGVEEILNYFNLTKEEAIAFGDGTNDVEMLKAVGWSVAMENATEDLKAVAKAICPSVKEEGVYTYCKEIGLI